MSEDNKKISANMSLKSKSKLSESRKPCYFLSDIKAIGTFFDSKAKIFPISIFKNGKGKPTWEA